MLSIGVLFGGVSWASASAVSDDGSVIVGTATSGAGQEAFLWRENPGMKSLHDVLELEYGLDLTGWQLRQATGVSADGTVIVGFGGHDGVSDEAWRVSLNAVPLPASLPLLASALGLVFMFRGWPGNPKPAAETS